MRAFVVRVASPDDFDGVGALLRASYPELMRAAYDADELAPALELPGVTSLEILFLSRFDIGDFTSKTVGDFSISGFFPVQ